MRLTLRTLLAYLDDTLEPTEARELGLRVSQSEFAQELVDRIKKATRRRGLATPAIGSEGDVSDPNMVAEYLSDALPADQVARVEENCLNSDAHLAEVAACHQILTLVLTEPVRVPPTAHQRMYQLVRKPASQPNRVPGRTVPIGGAMPSKESLDPDEHDAALLLGMRRYSSRGSLAGRIFQLILVTGLACCLLVAIVMAVPRSASGPPTAAREPAVVALAPIPKESVPSGSKNLPAENTKPPLPVEPEKGPVRVAALPEAPMPRLVGEAPEVKGDLPAPPAPPRDVRRLAGKLENADQVIVLAQSREGNSYDRIMTDNSTILTNDSIVCLPGYKAKVRLESGLLVDLWANTPEQLPGGVFETHVVFHAPADGFDGDITVRGGRIFLTTSKPGGAKIRLRVAGEIWDATLVDEKAEALLEVIPSFEPGTPFLKDGGEMPRVAVALAITRGKVRLAIPGVKDFGLASAPRAYFWDNKGGPLPESKEIPKSDYFSRFPLLPPDAGGGQQTRALAMQKALSDLASHLTAKDGLKTRIAELLSDEGDFSNLSRVMAVKHAVYSAAAIDEPVYLVDALNSELKPFTRDAATFAIERWMPMDGDNTRKLYQQLLNKQFGAEPAASVVKLLRHYSPEEIKKPETLDNLVNLMGSGESPAIRELAFWTLINFVDPTAFENGRLNRFDAGGKPADREMVAAAWRQRVNEIKKRNADEAMKK